MTNYTCLALLSIIALTGCTSASEQFVLPQEDSVTVEELARFPSFTEGVVFDKDGNAYVSELLRGVISKRTPAGEIAPWATLMAPNGHRILPDGTHLVCDGGLKAVVHIAANGEIIGNAADQFDGQPLKGPNDIVLDGATNGFYFTDPQGSWVDTRIGSVFYVDGEGEITSLVDTLAYPNGIVLDSKRSRLIVNEFALNRVLVFPLIAPNKLGEGEVFADLPKGEDPNGFFGPDGMIIDDEGNIYVAHVGLGSIQVLDHTGQLIRSYKTNIVAPTNLVARKTADSTALYVTGAVSLPHTESEGALMRLGL